MVLTSRVVVADGKERGVAEHAASRALDGGTAGLLRVLPDKLGEVTKLAEVGTRRRIGLAKEVVVADLGLVPLLCNGLANGSLVGAEITSGTDTSEVLAVCIIRTALLPIRLSVCWAGVDWLLGQILTCRARRRTFSPCWQRTEPESRPTGGRQRCGPCGRRCGS